MSIPASPLYHREYDIWCTAAWILELVWNGTYFTINNTEFSKIPLIIVTYFYEHKSLILRYAIVLEVYIFNVSGLNLGSYV